jgi:hypothetical protein
LGIGGDPEALEKLRLHFSSRAQLVRPEITVTEVT